MKIALKTIVFTLLFSIASLNSYGQSVPKSLKDIEDGIDTKIEALLEAERETLPVAGELLYEISNLSGYHFNSANGATNLLADAEAELAFGKKFMLDIKQAGTNAWEPQLQSPVNSIAVNNGDKILYIFFIRKTEPEQNGEYGQAAFFAQRSSAPWTGLGSLSLTVYDNWRKYYVLAKATDDYAIGEMGSTFHLGFKKQKIEIGGAIALNMGSEVSDDDLPQNDIFYEGMEEDAAWRIEAEAGIEANRKANISIEVMDKDGNPIEGASISMQMKKHHFGFGSFISDLLLANSSDGDKYREHFIDLFNVGTTPFYMGGNNDNWGWYGSSTSRTNYPKFAEWFKDNNIPAKGHVLVWPAWEWMPSYFEDLGNEPAALEEAISDHLDLIVPIGKQNNLYEWDVLNEPFINHDVMDILGEEIMVQWFNHVRNLDSNPKLIMNEYNIIQGGGRADFQDNFIRLINYLKDQAAPLGGIGMQCHFDENLTGITAVLATLDRFGELGLPIQITEFDIDTRDEEIQAAYTRDFYTAVFSHPAAEKIVMWGFYETTMWKPNGALVRPDWSHKPNYDVYKDLVYNQWWNEDIEGLTNSEGNFTARGFKGRYDISIITADTSYSIEINMKDEASIEIRGSQIDKTVVGVENLKEETSGEISTYPNPFTTSTNIRYTLEKASKVNFKLFNYNGQLVRELNQNQSQAGTFEIELNGHDLEPGIYMCMAKAENSHFRDNSIVLLKLE